MNIYRPKRDFIIQARNVEETLELDPFIQAGIEEKLSSYIQQDETFLYAAQSNASAENFDIELMALIKTEARRLLTEAHNNADGKIADLSENQEIIKDIVLNASEMAQQQKSAKNNLEQSNRESSSIIPNAIDDGEGMILGA